MAIHTGIICFRSFLCWAILMAYGLQGLSRNVAYIFAGLTIVAGVAHFGPESAALVQNWSQREARYDIRKAAELIQEDGANEKAVYAPIHHLVYWYLGSGSLPSRVVHPANLAEESIMGPLVEHGYLPAYELKRFWSNRLDYVIVSPGRPWYFSGDEYQAFQFAWPEISSCGSEWGVLRFSGAKADVSANQNKLSSMALRS